MKKICIVIGSRANYSSIKSAMRAITVHPDLELQVVAAASALLDRYGQVVLPIGLGMLIWMPTLACVLTTLAAIGCGLVGVFSPAHEQRHAALHGLLKAAVPTVVGGSFMLLLVALASMNWE